MKKRYLILQNGEIYEGYSFGADKVSVGELVFTTGMCGYIETLTDPSYYGQIVMHTFPLIGNYGIIPEDFEGKCAISGYVVREKCDEPSNFRCAYTLDKFLKDNGVPGICGVDTRQITRTIRDCGVMNALITDDPDSTDMDALRSYSIRNAVASVSRKNRTIVPVADRKCRIALIDYGEKRNIVRELHKRGCEVTICPADTSAEEILALGYDGVMLSNGPGDPAENVYCIEQIRQLLGKLPIFGICLGHQLLAIACGGNTEKLKYGHRGANQPVKDLERGRTYITSQNHGYAVVSDSITNGRMRFVNANDNTCEGIDYPGLKAFSVQFHPEACSGPHDTGFLFDIFVGMIEK